MSLDWYGRNVMVVPSATAKSIQKSLEIGRGAPGTFSIAEIQPPRWHRVISFSSFHANTQKCLRECDEGVSGLFA